MDGITEHLTRFACSLKYEDLTREDIHECKRRVIDSLGIAMGGYQEKPCQVARSLALEVTGRHGATLLGTVHTSTPEMATFANATMIHSQDYMDTYLSKEACHPSDNIAAVLAVAEHAGVGGREAILSIILAYEVMCRLCDAAGVRERGWDHVVYGAISTAVATGRVLSLDDKQMGEAVSLAATPNGALRQTRVGEISMWKACAPANAARNGVFASLLASRGLTGPGQPFEGEKGFQKQISGPLELPPFGGRGRPLMIHRTHIKRWPVQYNTQAGIQAALELRKELDSVDDLQSIVVDISDVGADLSADTEDKWNPRTRETADHSLPYIVLSALMDGDVTQDTFDMERIRDPKWLKLLKKVKVRRNSEFSSGYPEVLSVGVEVVTKGGSRLAKQVDFPPGHARNPMSDDPVEEKFRRLAAPLLSKRQVEQALDLLWHLEDVDDVGVLLRLFEVNQEAT